MQHSGINLDDYYTAQEPIPRDKWPYKTKVRPAIVHDLEPREAIAASSGGCELCGGKGLIETKLKHVSRTKFSACLKCGGTGRTQQEVQ